MFPGDRYVEPAPMRRLARRVALTGCAMALGVVLFLVDSIVLGGPGDDAPKTARRGTVAAAPARGSVAELQLRLERVPGDWVAWAALGSTYVEQARRTGDPSTYPRAEAAFAESLRVHPVDNAKAVTGRANLAAARHDFAAAFTLASEATAINAFDAAAYGVLTDALVELGRYDEADITLQRMADLSPDSSALARISYLRELRGDILGAREAMERSRSQAYSPAAVAFASFHLGELAFNAGDLASAHGHYAESLRRDPGYLPAVAGSAKVAAARGDASAAIAGYRRVVDALPLPQYATELGDLFTSLGQQDEAAMQYAVVTAQTRLIRANGGSADLEAALFAADHGDPKTALTLAQREHAARQSIHTDDALAWALHRNGRNAEALVLSERSLRLGTRDASLHFHRGMISSALGLADQARVSLQTALEINPYFSLVHAPAARRELARFGAAG